MGSLLLSLGLLLWTTELHLTLNFVIEIMTEFTFIVELFL